MPTRRRLLGQLSALALSAPTALRAQDRYDQAALMQFDVLGDITLLHYSDLRGMLRPHYLRPSVRSSDTERPPGSDEAFRIRYGIGGRTPLDAALTAEGFDSLAQVYGPMGGLAHIASIINAVRARRPGALVLDGGGSDEPQVTLALRPDAATYDRADIAHSPAALSLNAEGSPDHKLFERGGTQVAVIGLADPHLPGVGFDLQTLQAQVTQLRAEGAAVVVLLSQMGTAADRAIAGGVDGLDVILSGRDGAALPAPEVVGGTHIVASGSQGRFVTRVDIAVEDGRMAELRHRLIPIFANLIRPDPHALALIGPPDAGAAVATAGVTLHHQDTFGGTWEALLAEAMMTRTGADAALVPPLRAAGTVLEGQRITTDALQTLAAGRGIVTQEMTGAEIREMLEAEADEVFAKDPFARQGSRIMRTGGIGFSIAPKAERGARVSDLVRVRDGAPVADDETLRVVMLVPEGDLKLVDAVESLIAGTDPLAVAPAPVRIIK